MSTTTQAWPDRVTSGGRSQIVALVAAACLLVVWLLLRDLSTTRLIGIVAGVFALTAVQIATLKRATRIAVPAAAVMVGALNMVGLFGFLFFRHLAAQAQVSAALPQTDAVYAAAAKVFLAASLAVWLGGMAAGIGRARSTNGRPAKEVLRSISPAGALVAGFVPLAMNIAGFSPNGLIDRPRYLAAEGIGFCVSLGSLLTPIGLAVLAFTVFDPRRRFTVHLYAGLLLFAHIVVLFSMGTRQMSLLPGILLLGWAQTRNDDRRIPRSLIAAVAVLTLLAIQMPLNLRGNPTGAGLAPFTHIVLSQPEVLVAIHPGAVFGNILFSFPLAGTILELRGGTLPIHGFFTSISPLPSRYTDWATVFPTLGLNDATPFSGLGELAAHGWPFVVGYMFTVALVLGLLQRSAHLLRPSAATIASLAVLGVTVVFTFDALQYNLRSGLRPVWYVILIVGAMHVLAREQKSEADQGR